jgi:hypothetical protein
MAPTFCCSQRYTWLDLAHEPDTRRASSVEQSPSGFAAGAEESGKTLYQRQE